MVKEVDEEVRRYRDKGFIIREMKIGVMYDCMKSYDEEEE